MFENGIFRENKQIPREIKTYNLPKPTQKEVEI